MSFHFIFNLIGPIIVFAFLIRFVIFKSLTELNKILKLKRNGIRVKGIIRDFQVVKNTDGAGKTFEPLIEFTTLEGKELSFYSQYGRFKEPIIGAEVMVIYDIKDPTINTVDYNRALFYILLKLIFCIIIFFAIFYNAIVLKTQQ
jgi:hypothetical protein